MIAQLAHIGTTMAFLCVLAASVSAIIITLKGQ